MTPSGSPEPSATLPPSHHAEAAGKAAAPGTATQVTRTPRENRALMRVSSGVMQAIIALLGEHVATFAEFPPRQEAASLDTNKAIEKAQNAAATR